MSDTDPIDAIEEYERQLEARRARVRKVLRWIPLGLAGMFLVISGFILLTAGSGHQENLDTQSQMLQQRSKDADAAEKEFQSLYRTVLGQATATRPERMQQQQQWMRDTLSAAVRGENHDAQLGAAGIKNDDPFRTEFLHQLGHDEIPGVKGKAMVSDFDPMLVDINGDRYTYFAVVEFSSAEASIGQGPRPAIAAYATVSWSTDSEGKVTAVKATWNDGQPKDS